MSEISQTIIDETTVENQVNNEDKVYLQDIEMAKKLSDMDINYNKAILNQLKIITLKIFERNAIIALVSFIIFVLFSYTLIDKIFNLTPKTLIPQALGQSVFVLAGFGGVLTTIAGMWMYRNLKRNELQINGMLRPQMTLSNPLPFQQPINSPLFQSSQTPNYQPIGVQGIKL